MEMETDSMKRILFFAILISCHSFSAVKKNAPSLEKVRSEVLQMGARLNTLEKEIGSKNNLYLSSIEQIKQFEADVQIYRDKVTELQNELSSTQKDNKHIIQSYLIEVDESEAEIWQRKVHLELLKQAQTKLKEKETELKSFQDKVTEFDARLNSLRGNEEELASVIKELEDRKKATMEQYLAKVEEKKKTEKLVQNKKVATQVKKIKAKFSKAPVVESRPDRLFKNPVEDFTSFASSKKGVTFKFKSIQPVKAVGGGKVVYAGDLSNYGQVVLIDHGNDLRTVLLGKMDVRVKKNDSVNDGDILAYTHNDSQSEQNIYFEVRKKNTAQNTILWLESRGVSKI